MSKIPGHQKQLQDLMRHSAQPLHDKDAKKQEMNQSFAQQENEVLHYLAEPAAHGAQRLRPPLFEQSTSQGEAQWMQNAQFHWHDAILEEHEHLTHQIQTS